MENQDLNFDTKSNKGNLIGTFLVVLSLCLYVLFTRPVSADIEGIQTSIDTKTTEIETVSQKITEYELAQEEFDITTEVQRLNSLKAIPIGINQDNAIRDVIDIAETYDIILNSISFGKGRTETEGVSALRISASFEGNYTDLIDFLEGLEQNERLFLVENISVQVSRLDISKIERASFSLTIQSFYQEEL